jgi:hypothetical protein
MKYAKRVVSALEEIPNLLGHHTSTIRHLTYRTSRWALPNYGTFKINFEWNYLMSYSLPPANATLTPSSTYTLCVCVYVYIYIYIYFVQIYFSIKQSHINLQYINVVEKFKRVKHHNLIFKMKRWNLLSLIKLYHNNKIILIIQQICLLQSFKKVAWII